MLSGISDIFGETRAKRGFFNYWYIKCNLLRIYILNIVAPMLSP